MLESKAVGLILEKVLDDYKSRIKNDDNYESMIDQPHVRDAERIIDEIYNYTSSISIPNFKFFRRKDHDEICIKLDSGIILFDEDSHSIVAVSQKEFSGMKNSARCKIENDEKVPEVIKQLFINLFIQ